MGAAACWHLLCVSKKQTRDDHGHPSSLGSPQTLFIPQLCCTRELQRAMRGLWCCSPGSCCGTEMPTALEGSAYLFRAWKNKSKREPAPTLSWSLQCSTLAALWPSLAPLLLLTALHPHSPAQGRSPQAPAVPQPSPVTALDSALPQQSRAWKNKLRLQRCFSRVFIQCQSEEQNSVQTTPQCLAGCCTEPWVGEFTVGGGGRGCSFAV